MSNLRLGQGEYSLYLSILFIAVPIILVLSLFHSCDVRFPLDKRACRAGKVQACVTVAEAYESVQPDDFSYIFSMIFGYHAAAKKWFGEACKLGNAPACERFGYLSEHSGDDWFADSLSEADSLEGYGKACEGGVADACEKALEMARSSCTEGNKDACRRADELGKRVAPVPAPAR